MPVTEAAFEVYKDRLAKVEQDLAVRQETLKGISERLSKIETTLSRLTWIVITAVVGAALTFLLNGGVHVPGL